MTSNRMDEILDIVAQKALIDRSKLTPDVKLADLNVSSLDMVEVVFALEDKFGVQLPFNANTSATDIRTVGDVIAMVEKQLAGKGT
ncbi:MAG: acyl carrier protein [Alphaproteobacteria bacterium]|nr:acyl carrier protein [Alphaproteobacteria bacterium]